MKLNICFTGQALRKAGRLSPEDDPVGSFKIRLWREDDPVGNSLIRLCRELQEWRKEVRTQIICPNRYRRGRGERGENKILPTRKLGRVKRVNSRGFRGRVD